LRELVDANVLDAELPQICESPTEVLIRAHLNDPDSDRDIATARFKDVRSSPREAAGAA
jgi:hypothetical protein